jgi:hypothetical protein
MEFGTRLLPFAIIPLPPLVRRRHQGFWLRITFPSRLFVLLIDRDFLQAKRDVVLDVLGGLEVVGIIIYHDLDTLGSCSGKPIAPVVQAIRELNNIRNEWRSRKNYIDSDVPNQTIRYLPLRHIGLFHTHDRPSSELQSRVALPMVPNCPPSREREARVGP